MFLDTEFQILVPVASTRTPAVAFLPWYPTSGLMNASPYHWKAIHDSGSLLPAAYLMYLYIYVYCLMSNSQHYTDHLSQSLYLMLDLSPKLFQLPVARTFLLLPVAPWCGCSSQPNPLWFGPPHHHPRPGLTGGMESITRKGEKVQKRKAEERGKVT